MQKNLLLYAAVIGLLMMVTISLILYSELKESKISNANIDIELKQLKTSLSILNSEKSRLELQLNQTSTEMGKLTIQHEALTTSYDAIDNEIEQTIGKIEEFEEELNSSLAWFNRNSRLEGIPNEKRTQNTLSRCWDVQNGVCKVRLGCFYLINSEKLGLEYKYDTITSKAEDKLQSLKEFMHNWGGDCEDYSLFFKAEYNYIFDKCYERGAESIELEAWIPGSRQYFLDFVQEWYISDAEKYTLPDEHIYPSVVCGDMYDPHKGAVSGHCVIAYSDTLVETPIHLDGAALIEPQNGQFLGIIGTDIAIEPTDQVSSIWMVITDSDLFLWSEENEWVGYESMLQDISLKREHLEVLR